MRKRILSLVLAVLMLASALSITAFATEYAYGQTPAEGKSYEEGDTIWVKGNDTPKLYKTLKWEKIGEETKRTCGKEEHIIHTAACGWHREGIIYVPECGKELHKHLDWCYTTYKQYKAVKNNKAGNDSTAVYIAIMQDNNAAFPNEPTQSSYSYYYWYKENGYWRLDGSATPYSQTVDGLIDTAKFYAANLQTKYETDKKGEVRRIDGDINHNGHDLNTLSYTGNALKSLDQQSIINAWHRKTSAPGEASDYKLLIYVIKNEQGKGAIAPGWHIDCKVVKKENVTLSYNDQVPTTATSRTFDNPDNQSVAPGTECTVASMKLRSDETQVSYTVGDDVYTFTGWNTKSDGTGTTYQPNGKIEVSENTTLYAQWQKAEEPPVEPEQMQITVIKAWAGDFLENGVDRPASATVQLMRKIESDTDYTPYGNPIVLTLSNTVGSTVFAQSVTVDKTNADGVEYTYSAVEIAVAGAEKDTTTGEFRITAEKGKGDYWVPSVETLDDGNNPGAKKVTLTNTYEYEPEQPALSITKTAYKLDGENEIELGENDKVQVGDTIIYKIKVKNTGNVPLPVVVRDTFGGFGTLRFANDNEVPFDLTLGTLAPGAEWQEPIEYKYTVVLADALGDDPEIVNTAAAMVNSDKLDESKVVTKVVAPVIDVTKEVTKIVREGEEQADKTTARAGDTIHYTITITNNTSLVIEDVKVSDTFYDGLGTALTFDSDVLKGDGMTKEATVTLQPGKTELKATYTVQVGCASEIENSVTLQHSSVGFIIREVQTKIEKDEDAYEIHVPIIKTLKNEGTEHFTEGAHFRFTITNDKGQVLDNTAQIFIDDVSPNGRSTTGYNATWDGDHNVNGVDYSFKLSKSDYENLPVENGFRYVWISEVNGGAERMTYSDDKIKLYLIPDGSSAGPQSSLGELLVTLATDGEVVLPTNEEIVPEASTYYALNAKTYNNDPWNDPWNGDMTEIYDFAAEFWNYYDKQEHKGNTVKVGPQLNRDDHVAYIMGYPDGNVRPEGEITRAEACTIFFRLLTEESRDYYFSKTNDYTDVKAGEWFNNAISTLSNAGIVTGYNDGTFRPNQPITRGEMAKIIANFANLNKGTKSFTDLSGHWSKTYVELAAGNGWIAGYPDGSFRPDQKITRAETVTMINRVLERVPAKESRLLSRSIMLTFPDNNPGDWYYIAMQEASNSHEYQRSVYETAGDEMWTKLIENVDWTKLER